MSDESVHSITVAAPPAEASPVARREWPSTRGRARIELQHCECVWMASLPDRDRVQPRCFRPPLLTICTTLNALAFVACAQAPRVEQDLTGPTLRWHVADHFVQTEIDILGSGHVTGNRDSDFLVTLTAADSDGIQSISLGGESSKTCGSEMVVQTVDELFAGQNQTVAAADARNAPTEIPLQQEVMSDSNCEVGLVWQKESIHLLGAGTNYSNGTTTSDLLIEILP